MASFVAIRAAALVLLAAAPGTELIDEVQTVSAADWAFQDVPLRKEPARISASYEVLEGSTQVRLALMLREDVDRIGEDLSASIVATGDGREGKLVDSIRRRGDYAVVLDNRDGKQSAKVRLRVWLDWNGPDVQSLIPRRQITVVALSCVAFLGIAGFSAKRLRKAMRA
jgi:hypothetical protein